MTLVNTYLKYTSELKKNYGDKSIVLMQVGAFYEVYGLQHPETNEIIGVVGEPSKIYHYTYDLYLFEEKLNILKFQGGTADKIFGN